MTTFEVYITDFTITKAFIDDREALCQLVENYHNPLLIIEDEQLNAEVVKAKLFCGLKTRIQTKIFTFNL